jgi:hypothetical protein
MSIIEELLYEYQLKKLAELYNKYKLLHYYSFRKYKRHNNFNLSIIPLNTILFLNLFQDYSFYKTYFSFFIGINVILNIIIKIARYLRDIELTVNHRMSYIGFRKLIRDINLELSIKTPVNTRKKLVEFCKNECNRLIENNPLISNKLINKFDTKSLSYFNYKITSSAKQPKK